MKTVYVCEKCGCNFETEEKAMQCEKSHGKMIKAEPMMGTYTCGVGMVYNAYAYVPKFIKAEFVDENGDYQEVKYKASI